MVEERKIEVLIKKSELLKVIAHPMRLRILHCLLENTCNVTKLVNEIGIPQSTISQHLSKLKMCGVIVGNRKGVEIEYTVVNKEVEVIIQLLLGECEEEQVYSENCG